MTTIVPRLSDRLRPLVQVSATSPAVSAGVRSAVATVVPLLAGHFLHAPSLLWASLAAFNASLADSGGAPYRTRAATMGTLTAASALAGVVAAVGGRHPGLAVPLMLLWGAAFSLARVYGAPGASVGTSAISTFVVSLASPALGASVALERGALLLAGGAWAMALSLVLWPLRPYRPVRLAVARSYRAVAAHAAHVARLAAEGSAADWQTPVRVHHPAVRETLELSRTALAATRRGRAGESGRGERLLVLLEAADQLFGTIIALAEVFESTAHDTRFAAARAEIARAASAFATNARSIADAIEAEGRRRPAPPVLDWDAGGARRALGQPDDADVTRAQYAHGAELLARLRSYAGVAAETAPGLEDGRPAAPPAPPLGAVVAVAEPPRPLLAPLRENLTLDSVVFRYALRVGVTTAVAAWLTTALGLSHGYWVTITAVVILQPYAGATRLKALQRVAGTVLGGMLAAALAAVVRDPLGILVLVFVLAAVCVSLLPVNYGAFSVFLTPTFVLLAEVNAGDWHLAGVRIANTLFGGALALAGSWLLWPSPEQARFPELMAAALRANRDYLRRAAAPPSEKAASADGADPTLQEARRRVGLATINAESSFQRLLTESRGGPAALEPVMALLTYTRRFAAAVTALALVKRDGAAGAAPATSADALGRFAAVVSDALEDMAAAVTRHGPPAPMPELDPLIAADGHGPLFRAQLERVARQLAVLHDAVERQAAGE